MEPGSALAAQEPPEVRVPQTEPPAPGSEVRGAGGGRQGLPGPVAGRGSLPGPQKAAFSSLDQRAAGGLLAADESVLLCMGAALSGPLVAVAESVS